MRDYLTDQYFSRGKYGVQIETTVDELAGNRVNILIDIKEGDRARIRQISIVGNTKFSEKDILETLELKTPRWNSFYKQNDRYAREAMQGTWRSSRAGTRTAATRTSRSSPCRWPSRPRRTTCSSR